MYVAVLSRFGRMPRCGWAQALNVFNGKFIASVPMQEFMKQAKAAIITENGNYCSIKNFDAEAAKRRKTREEVFEENTICEAKLFLQVRESFLSKIKSISERKIEEFVRTHKIPYEKLDHSLLEILNRAVAEYTSNSAPKSMGDLARILQAVQECYQETKTKIRAPSPWKASIEAKIGKLQSSMNLLKKDNLEEEDKRRAKKLMREMQLVLEKPRDVVETTSKLNESILIYQQKLVSHERRKEFRKENQCFELYRSRYYRQLSGEKGQDHNVPMEDIKSF